MSDEDIPGVESRIDTPDLSCPRCKNLLPSGLGEITCLMCKAESRLNTRVLGNFGERKKLVVLHVQRCWSVVLTKDLQTFNVHLVVYTSYSILIGQKSRLHARLVREN